MGVKRDGMSGFGFYTAFVPQDIVGGSTYNGDTIDLQGYNTCTFAVIFGSTAGSAAFTAQYWNVRLEHGLASATGVSAWSDVTAVNILHSVYGSAGAYSALTSGICMSILLANIGSTLAVGYVGDVKHRYVRMVFSDTGTCSTASVAAVAILGAPGQWPVIEPVGH
jgi:hypothetical protein